MESTAADLLTIIKRNGDLTVPELVARVDADADAIVQDLRQLHALGLIDADKPEAFDELAAWAQQIQDRMQSRSPLDKRIELLRLTSRQQSISRHTVLTSR